jgi:hypothetical protein
MTLEHSVVKSLFQEHIDTKFPSGAEKLVEWNVPTGEGANRSFFFSDHDSVFELSIQTSDGQASENILHIVFVMNDDENNSKILVTSDAVSDANYSRIIPNSIALKELKEALKVFDNLNTF